KKRGVVLKEGQTLRDLYNERHPLYEKYADIIIDAHLKSPEDVMMKICEAIGK
ncbi:MAG: shikimate kinase, partial [Lachnospiraceae bacterium]|nr:shikimate kinase [Lachnospiraceae bacterium]